MVVHASEHSLTSDVRADSVGLEPSCGPQRSVPAFRLATVTGPYVGGARKYVNEANLARPYLPVFGPGAPVTRAHPIATTSCSANHRAIAPTETCPFPVSVCGMRSVSPDCG